MGVQVVGQLHAGRKGIGQGSLLKLHQEFHLGFGIDPVERGLLFVQVIGNGLETFGFRLRRGGEGGGHQAEDHDHRQHQRQCADATIVLHFLFLHSG